MTENYNLRLRENVAKLLIAKIEANFNRLVNHRGRNWTYETILRQNILGLAAFIEGRNKSFEFEIPEVVLDRSDDLGLRKRILEMSPEGRRKLGINKSTLWYQKNHLHDGRSIKVYAKVRKKL